MKFLAVFVVLVAGACAAPLTADQAKIMKSTWEGVKHNEVDILYYIFKSYPEIQARFPLFVGKDLDSIKGTPEFTTHATRIVSFMSDVIGLTGNPANLDAISTLVTQMAYNHKNRGITQSYFNNFYQALFNYLKSHVSGWNDETAAVWTLGMDNYKAMAFKVIEQ